MAQPILPSRNLPALPAECLQLDYIHEAFGRQVAWQVEPLFRDSFSADPADARPAAVLMPLVQRDASLNLVFTRRAEHLHSHAGQISFPGGCIEAGDRDPIATALRETREEIGVDGRYVRVIGTQPALLTTTHYYMTPIVGELLPGFSIHADVGEVAEVFEVPLTALLDPSRHSLHHLQTPLGRERYYFSISWQSYFIWGATATLLRNFYHFLAATVPHGQTTQSDR